jgi:uncharacterized coiled-coil protein SlyX
MVHLHLHSRVQKYLSIQKKTAKVVNHQVVEKELRLNKKAEKMLLNNLLNKNKPDNKV